MHEQQINEIIGDAVNGLLIGRIRGIDIRFHWSVLAIMSLLTWSLAESIFPEFESDYSSADYWIVAFVSTVGFFVGLLAHEVGHALVAQRVGVGVRSITLWLFGGVASLESEPETPQDSFKIAAAGPAVSLLLGAVGLAVGIPLGGLAGVALTWFGLANLLLGMFNLLPAFPLDGGRIYQSWRWARTGDTVSATRAASAVGLAVGAGLIGLGLLQVLAGGAIGGVWTMGIGWFLREAARQESRHAVLRISLDHIHVGHVMTPHPMIIDPGLSIEDFIAHVFFGGRHAAYPIGTDEAHIDGLITLNSVRKVATDQLDKLRVRDVATPLRRLVIASPSDPISELLPRLEKGSNRALVFEGGTLVGIVSPSDLTRTIDVVGLAAPTLDLRALAEIDQSVTDGGGRSALPRPRIRHEN